MGISSFFFAGWSSLARIVIVGVPAYFLLLALLHLVGKHSLAKTNAYGFVVTVALGSALASAVLTKEVTLADGVVAIGILLGLQYLLSTLISRWSWANNFITQKPVLLVRDGHLLNDALKRERVTKAEILAALRQNGIDSIDGVGAVVLESDGSFSVIRKVGQSPSALEDVKSIGQR
jgi:uncharacterized membrane protein YcaP (DUF421 family)